MPSPPGTPPVPPCNTEGNGSYEIEGMPSRCVYIHSPHSNAQFINHKAYTNSCKLDEDFIPDLLCTLSAVWKYCWHWFWRWQQPCEPIWEWRQEIIERNGISKKDFCPGWIALSDWTPCTQAVRDTPVADYSWGVLSIIIIYNYRIL